MFAAASLSGAFQVLGDAFERAHPETRVRFNFAGSQQLALQLEQGAEADLFAPADERWMTYARERGLLADRPAVFARNRLVVIVPAANPARLTRLQDLARPGVKLVVGAATVPVGTYTRRMLAGLTLASGFPADFDRRVLANVVSQEENVKAVVAKVELGEADAGVVYRSDATGEAAPRIRTLPIPESRNVTAEYPLATLCGAPSPRAAAAFVRLLLGAEGRAVLRRFGLTPAPAASGTDSSAVGR